MADDSDKETISEAHTRADLSPEPQKSAKLDDQTAVAQAALDDLAGQIDGGTDPEQSSLFEDEECLFSGPVAHVAETFQAAKGRGRPKGSKNKSNQLFRDYLLKQGYRHPGLNLADLANADPLELAAELSQPYQAKSGPRAGQVVEVSCTPADAMELIRKANVELMPYFESKRPTETKHTEAVMGVLVIESSDQSGQGQVEEGVYSVTGVVGQNPDNSDT